jgi:hypothetical protein
MIPTKYHQKKKKKKGKKQIRHFVFHCKHSSNYTKNLIMGLAYQEGNKDIVVFRLIIRVYSSYLKGILGPR